MNIIELIYDNFIGISSILIIGSFCWFIIEYKLEKTDEVKKVNNLFGGNPLGMTLLNKKGRIIILCFYVVVIVTFYLAYIFAIPTLIELLKSK